MVDGHEGETKKGGSDSYWNCQQNELKFKIKLALVVTGLPQKYKINIK